jgi:hypothetical protein
MKDVSALSQGIACPVAHGCSSQSTCGTRGQALMRWSVIALLLLGTALRLRHYLAAPSFWFDEAFLLLNIVERGPTGLMGPLGHQQAAPPLYMWTLRALYVAFGCSEWSMRLPALAGGIAMVWLALPWARQHLGRAGTFCLLALAATSVHGLQHADEVKPYALDAMWSLLILYIGQRALPSNGSRADSACLIGLAMLGPWVSFPSVFALFGVGIAWLVEVCRRRERISALGLVLFGLLGAGSCFLFWRLVGRHQHTRDLTTWWNDAFWDFSSLRSALAWPLECLFNLVNYATTGLGFAFLILAPIGIWSLGRRSSIMLRMMAGMIGAALLASALRKYPLDGRVTYFMAPLVWLISASAVDACCRRLKEGWRWLPAALLLAICSGDLARTCKATWHVDGNGDFRSAIAFADDHWREGDMIWQYCVEVYRLYHGSDHLDADAAPPWTELASGPPARRLWMISPPGLTCPDGWTWTSMQQHLAAKGWRKIEDRHFMGVEVVLYAPPSQP